MDVDENQQQDHFLEVNLINGAQAFDEVSRWIDVRAPLTNVGKELREKSGAHCIWAVIVPVNRFARLIRKSRPTGDTRLKFMREIDIFLRGQSFLNLPERRVAFAFCYRERHRESKS